MSMETIRLRADAAALAEVEHSLRYSLRQWEAHGPPPDYDQIAFARDLLAIIEQVRGRVVKNGGVR